MADEKEKTEQGSLTGHISDKPQTPTLEIYKQPDGQYTVNYATSDPLNIRQASANNDLDKEVQRLFGYKGWPEYKEKNLADLTRKREGADEKGEHAGKLRGPTVFPFHVAYAYEEFIASFDPNEYEVVGTPIGGAPLKLNERRFPIKPGDPGYESEEVIRPHQWDYPIDPLDITGESPEKDVERAREEREETVLRQDREKHPQTKRGDTFDHNQNVPLIKGIIKNRRSFFGADKKAGILKLAMYNPAEILSNARDVIGRIEKNYNIKQVVAAKFRGIFPVQHPGGGYWRRDLAPSAVRTGVNENPYTTQTPEHALVVDTSNIIQNTPMLNETTARITRIIAAEFGERAAARTAGMSEPLAQIFLRRLRALGRRGPRGPGGTRIGRPGRPRSRAPRELTSAEIEAEAAAAETAERTAAETAETAAGETGRIYSAAEVDELLRAARVEASAEARAAAGRAASASEEPLAKAIEAMGKSMAAAIKAKGWASRWLLTFLAISAGTLIFSLPAAVLAFLFIKPEFRETLAAAIESGDYGLLVKFFTNEMSNVIKGFTPEEAEGFLKHLEEQGAILGPGAGRPGTTQLNKIGLTYHILPKGWREGMWLTRSETILAERIGANTSFELEIPEEDKEEVPPSKPGDVKRKAAVAKTFAGANVLFFGHSNTYVFAKKFAKEITDAGGKALVAKPVGANDKSLAREIKKIKGSFTHAYLFLNGSAYKKENVYEDAKKEIIDYVQTSLGVSKENILVSLPPVNNASYDEEDLRTRFKKERDVDRYTAHRKKAANSRLRGQESNVLARKYFENLGIKVADQIISTDPADFTDGLHYKAGSPGAKEFREKQLLNFTPELQTLAVPAAAASPSSSSEVSDIIKEEAQAAGVDPKIALAIGYMESNLGKSSENVFQFVEKFKDGWKTKYGLDWENVNDARENAKAAMGLIKDKITFLKNRGIIENSTVSNVDPAEAHLIYLSYQQGNTGFAKLFQAAKENQSATPKQRAAIDSNVGSDGKGISPREFFQYWRNRLDKSLAVADRVILARGGRGTDTASGGERKEMMERFRAQYGGLYPKEELERFVDAAEAENVNPGKYIRDKISQSLKTADKAISVAGRGILKRFDSSGGVVVLDPRKAYVTPSIIPWLQGLSDVSDGKWVIGDISLPLGGGEGEYPKGTILSPASRNIRFKHKTHRLGRDVDISLPLKGGKTNKWNENITNPSLLDEEKLLDLLKHFYNSSAKSYSLLNRIHVDHMRKYVLNNPKYGKDSEEYKLTAAPNLRGFTAHYDHIHFVFKDAASAGSLSSARQELKKTLTATGGSALAVGAAALAGPVPTRKKIPGKPNFSYILGDLAPGGQIYAKRDENRLVASGASMNKPILALVQLLKYRGEPEKQLNKKELDGLLSYTRSPGFESNHVNRLISGRDPIDKRLKRRKKTIGMITNNDAAAFLKKLGLDPKMKIRFGDFGNNEQTAKQFFDFMRLIHDEDKLESLGIGEEASTIVNYMKRNMPGVEMGGDRESKKWGKLAKKLNSAGIPVDSMYGKGGLINQGLHYSFVINDRYLLSMYSDQGGAFGKNYRAPFENKMKKILKDSNIFQSSIAESKFLNQIFDLIEETQNNELV